MNPMIIVGGAAVLLAALKKSSAKKGACPKLTPGEGNIAGYRYIEFTTGGASLDEKLPIIFFFHCRACNPKNLAKHIKDIPAKTRIVMPYGHRGKSSNPVWFELKASTDDQDKLASQMELEAKNIVKFIKMANRCLKGDGKPMVTGHSQGGMLALAVAAEDPEIVKVAVPVSSWLPVDLWPKSLPRTIVVHGTSDRTVDYNRTADFVSRAQGAGLDIEFYPIKNHGHSLSKNLKSKWLETLNSEIG